MAALGVGTTEFFTLGGLSQAIDGEGGVGDDVPSAKLLSAVLGTGRASSVLSRTK
jgi:hypothetical protein